MRNSNIDEQLRAWAEGSYTAEAAAELLIRALGGRFARPGLPWIRHAGGDHWWIDFDAILDTDPFGCMSGGERRILTIVASLGAGRPVDLSDAITGLDPTTLQLVLAAIAHAAGAHETYEINWTTGGLERPTNSHAWPVAAPTAERTSR